LTGDEGQARGLVAAAIRGDADAVRALWQEHRRWVAAVILAHKPRETELEDLLQDVAMTFVRTISRLRDEAMLRPWLRTVAVNAARAAGRDTRRKRERMGWKLGGTDEAESGPAAPVDRGREPDEATLRREDARRLMALATRLPEGYREPLLLKCIKGLSYREIGEMLGLPETTIETRIARGRKMLRELALGAGVGGATVGAVKESHS
jgi:RNA polymerase sigma-70 factor (ECF subfamily)